jgi:hypothetical protein
MIFSQGQSAFDFPNFFIIHSGTLDRKLKKLLYNEAGIEMSDQLLDRFIGATTEIHLKNKEVLILYGQIDTNLYVQKDGLLRACYIEDGNERAYGFSNPGTVVLSYHSHFRRKPAVFQIELCGETSLLKMSETRVGRT